jgi:hypothetical protein
LIRRGSNDLSKNVGDLNMRLKLEIGALKGENEDLARRNELSRTELRQLQEKMQVRSYFHSGKMFLIYYKLVF